VTILAFQAAVWTLPSPSVHLVLNSIQKVLASDNGVLWHVLSALSRISVEVNLLTVLFNHGAFAFPLQTLRIFEKRGKKSSRSLVTLLLLLCFMLLILSGSLTTLFVAVLHLTFDTLHIASRFKKWLDFCLRISPRMMYDRLNKTLEFDQ
jgi:hypothetical protein